MHLRMRLMKLQSKFCQKSSKQTSKKPWESCDWKKVSWAYRRGTWAPPPKNRKHQKLLLSKKRAAAAEPTKFASWNRRPGCLRSGRLLSAKGETRLPAKLGHLSLSKSHVANLRSVDWNSFTSYIQPCSKAWLKKLFSGPQRFMTYGAFIIISYS